MTNIFHSFILTNSLGTSACLARVGHAAGYTLTWTNSLVSFTQSLHLDASGHSFGSTSLVLSALWRMAGQRLRASLLVMHVLCALLTSTILPPLMAPSTILYAMVTIWCSCGILLFSVLLTGWGCSSPVDPIITPLVSLQCKAVRTHSFSSTDRSQKGYWHNCIWLPRFCVTLGVLWALAWSIDAEDGSPLRFCWDVTVPASLLLDAVGMIQALLSLFLAGCFWALRSLPTSHFLDLPQSLSHPLMLHCYYASSVLFYHFHYAFQFCLLGQAPNSCN